MCGDATHTLLVGGSRSGKTALIVRANVLRALKAEKSRHAILRYRFNHVKASVILDTFPKIMEKAFPGVPFVLDRTDWYAQFQNGSQIWFGGLDDKERTEKILGQEHATISLNECSQIPKSSRDYAVTRLAQKVDQNVYGKTTLLKPRMFYDENPPSKNHWTYRLFFEKRDPDTLKPLSNPDDYATFKLNPQDNIDNLGDGYIKTLEALPARLRKRFLEGEFADATENALFHDEDFDKWRVLDGKLPDMVRVVVAVDPSGSGDTDNEHNDAIGIVVAGLGTDGNAYVLEDCTVKAGPATWGRVVANAFDRHEADVVVGEKNYGGEMVKFTIQTARPRTNYKTVTATKGKVVRAEPIAALYDQGKVRHVGHLRDLEDELLSFSTNGYTGDNSPNRADAAIWSLTELFSRIVSPSGRKDIPRVEPWKPFDAEIGW